MWLDYLAHGVTDASAWTIVIYTLVVTQLTIMTVTIWLHRHSAHRALELHPVLKHFFRFWLWLTTGMQTKEWTAVHRKHHIKCETEEDPHSPVVNGLGEIFWKGVEYYKASITPETLEKYGRGTPDDWLEKNVYVRHSSMGITIMALTNIVLFGPIGLTVFAIQMLWIPIFAAGVVNGIGHWWGYRNFECPDAATNIIPIAFWVGGEELHNNHHTYPNSAKFSVKPWEFDMGWLYIRIFQAFGLAKPLNTGPIVERIPGKSSLDMDTTWAVINDRFRIMSSYAENIVAPMVEQEYKKADAATRRLIKRSKAVLCREGSLVDDAGQTRIAEVTAASPVLKQIYEMRLGLQDIWAKRGGNAEELLNSLKQWCAEAEESGINGLREFVEELKSYSIPNLARA